MSSHKDPMADYQRRRTTLSLAPTNAPPLPVKSLAWPAIDNEEDNRQNGQNMHVVSDIYPGPVRPFIPLVKSGLNWYLQPFRCLDLPAEIRNMVYQHSLSAVNPIEILQKTSPDATSSGISPQILLTCRQIYQEAVLILYHKNHFHLAIRVDQCEASKNFLKSIGSWIQHITTVTITHSCYNDETKRVFHLLKSCKALTSLTLDQAVWSRYQSARLCANALGPLARKLHRDQAKQALRENTQSRDVLAGIHLPTAPLATSTRRQADAATRLQRRIEEAGGDFEKRVRDLLRPTLK